MKLQHVLGLFLFALSALVYSCGSDDSDDDTTTTTKLAYSEVSTMLNSYCATSGCHVSGGTSPDLSTEAGATTAANATASATRISAGTMPPTGQYKTAWDAETQSNRDNLLKFFQDHSN